MRLGASLIQNNPRNSDYKFEQIGSQQRKHFSEDKLKPVKDLCLEAKEKVAAKIDSSCQHPPFESGTFGNSDSIFLTACPHARALK